jgi:hypothetical protein
MEGLGGDPFDAARLAFESNLILALTSSQVLALE